MFFDQYQVAETARKLGIMVISDEVYGHLTFGSAPFVPMGVFASTVPVLTLGSISKRWIVPGWRMGWLVTNDPNGILQDSGVGSLSLPRSRCMDVVFFFLILWELTCYPIMVQSLLFFLMITSMSALIWTCNLGFLTYLFVLPRLLRQSRTTSISLRILRLSFRFVIHETFPEEHIVGFPLRISLI